MVFKNYINMQTIICHEHLTCLSIIITKDLVLNKYKHKIIIDAVHMIDTTINSSSFL